MDRDDCTSISDCGTSREASVRHVTYALTLFSGGTNSPTTRIRRSARRRPLRWMQRRFTEERGRPARSRHWGALPLRVSGFARWQARSPFGGIQALAQLRLRLDSCGWRCKVRLSTGGSYAVNQRSCRHLCSSDATCGFARSRAGGRIVGGNRDGTRS